MFAELLLFKYLSVILLYLKLHFIGHVIFEGALLQLSKDKAQLTITFDYLLNSFIFCLGMVKEIQI